MEGNSKKVNEKEDEKKEEIEGKERLLRNLNYHSLSIFKFSLLFAIQTKKQNKVTKFNNSLMKEG